MLLIDPGHPERHRRPLRRAGQQPRHAGVRPRSDAAGRRRARQRVESRQERQGQGQGQALQSVQQEETVGIKPAAELLFTAGREPENRFRASA